MKEGTVIPKTGATITWIVDGVKTTEVYEKGTMPSFKGETTKAEDPHYSYTFAGWDCELVSVTEDATYTAQFNKTGKNGLCIEEDGTYWLVDGEHAEFPGLIRINAGTEEQPHYHYYYFGEDGKAVKDGDYKVDKNNGLPLPCYKYHFDENGIIEHDDDTGKNGICQGEESKLFYYIDGIKIGEGLIQIDGYYYYARTSSGEIVRNCDYWITKTNGLPIAEGKYHFDTDGKMQLAGFVVIDGNTYYYENGQLAKGLTKIGDDFYLFNDKTGKMYSGGNFWVGDNEEYGIVGGLYPFGKDGKMQDRNGWYEEKNDTYYYRNNELVKGFTKIEGSYYFFNKASGKLYKNATLWVADNTYGISAGMYSFGADGKMIVPDLENGVKAIVSENGKLYFTIDGARMFRGLYERNGEYYYANSNGELVVNSSAYINAEMLSGEGWYGFDAEGKLVKTGFVDGGGYTYYYDNGIRAKGFTKIGDAYYLFNAASGKMYKDATLWVGANNYGITGGLYYFDANGRMTSKAA